MPAGSSIKIGLADQLAEVGAELGMRRAVYPQFVARARYTQEEADLKIARMDAVYRTLKWLIANEDDVRKFIEQKQATKS